MEPTPSLTDEVGPTIKLYFYYWLGPVHSTSSSTLDVTSFYCCKCKHISNYCFFIIIIVMSTVTIIAAAVFLKGKTYYLSINFACINLNTALKFCIVTTVVNYWLINIPWIICRTGHANSYSYFQWSTKILLWKLSTICFIASSVQKKDA